MRGALYWQELRLKRPEGVRHPNPSGLLQKHAFSGLSCRVANADVGGTNLKYI